MPNSVDRMHVSSLWRAKEATGTALLILLIDEFGTELLSWEPLTVRMEIKDHWKVEPLQANLDKVNALVTYLTSNMFFQSLDVFMHTCTSLNNIEADFSQFDPPSVEEMAWAITEVLLLEPEEKVQFNSEIPSYMQIKLQDEGYHRVPKLLRDYVKLPVEEHTVSDALDDEGIESKSWWDSQQERLTAVDGFVRERLALLLSQIASLPLQHANQSALKDLQQRAQRLLAVQGQTVQREEERRGHASSL